MAFKLKYIPTAEKTKGSYSYV